MSVRLVRLSSFYFFFFFKQKTAYEMRISDWIQTCALPISAVLSWKPAPEWLVYASASKGYKAGGFNLDYSALDRPCSTTAGSDAQDAACVAALARPANTPGNARPETSDLQFASEKVDAYRSEVHTSELQSLIRI